MNGSKSRKIVYKGIAPLFCLCVPFIIASSSKTLADLAPYDEQRVYALISLCVAPLAVLLWSRNALAAAIMQIAGVGRIGLALIAAIGLASALIHAKTTHALLEVTLFILLFLTATTVSACYQTHKQPVTFLILGTFLTYAALQVVSASAGYIAALTNDLTLDNHDLFLNFSNVRFFNDIQSWTLPLLVLPLLLYPSLTARYRLIVLLLSSFWWLLLLVSGGRATTVGIIVAALTTLLVFRKKALPWLNIQIGCAVIGAILFFFFFTLLPFLLYGNAIDTSLIRGTTYDRIYLWSRAWELLQGQFLLGIGPMHYACDPSNPIAAHPHNALIQIATEWGIPAALLVVSIFLFGVYSWIRKINRQLHTLPDDQKHIHVALFASLIAGVTTSAFSGMIVMPLSQLVTAIVLGWILGLYFSDHPTKQPSTLSCALVGALFLFSASFSIYAMIETAPPKNTDEDQRSLEQLQFIPRFWQQGKICGDAQHNDLPHRIA